MPIYEYQCSKCGVVEAIQKFNDQPLKECPVCKTSNPQKIVSAAAFHLKGSGWYKSDYASAPSKKVASSADATSSSSSTESAAKCNTGCKCH